MGANLLRPKGRTDSLTLLLAQYKSPIILILVFACLLSFALGDQADALIILAILLVSGLLGFWQERGATNAVAKLLAIVQIKATVRRQGEPQEIPVEEIVPGDVVLLNAGDVIPGDSLILESKDLFVDEAALTGETFPVEKVRGSPGGGHAPGATDQYLVHGDPRGQRHRRGGGGPDRQRHRVRPGFSPTEAQAAGDGV